MTLKDRVEKMKPTERAAFALGMETAAELADTMGGNRAVRPVRSSRSSKEAMLDWVIFGQRNRAGMIATVIRKTSAELRKLNTPPHHPNNPSHEGGG